MKNEILDEIKTEQIHQLLEKEEKILWEGRPVSDSITKLKAYEKPRSR